MKELSKTELMLMRRVWKSEEPISATKVCHEVEEVYHVRVGRRTVGTMFCNLIEKGYIKVAYTKGKENYYVPLVDSYEAQKRKLRSVLLYWFDESVEELRSALVDIEKEPSGREADE